jgi:hypothetical protein
MDEDPFDSLLGLEDKFYSEGYQLGLADGTRAGHIEGRVFGLEKGFEKFIEMGKLHGRSLVWASRLAQGQKIVDQVAKKGSVAGGEKAGNETSDTALPGNLEAARNEDNQHSILPPLPVNPRLEKQLKTFYALVEVESLSTQNNEDDVADFDDRLKRALGKAKIVEKMAGEDGSVEERKLQAGGLSSSQAIADGSIEDASVLHARH